MPNGKDKILYFVEYNWDWVGVNHGSIKINGILVDRLSTAFVNNPFAAHYNSKRNSRYVATRVPKELIDPIEAFLTVEIDMRIQQSGFYFREAGTHDYM